MTKNFKRTIIMVFTILLLITVFTGCDMGLPWDNSLWGAWEDDYTIKTFTNTTWSFDGTPEGDGGWDYSGDIVKYVNGSYNIASETPATGECGYMVLKVTAHSGSDAAIGTFTVVRWRALATADGVTTVEHSEAYPASWTTAEAAEEEANETDNFSYYSALTKSAE